MQQLCVSAEPEKLGFFTVTLVLGGNEGGVDEGLGEPDLVVAPRVALVRRLPGQLRYADGERIRRLLPAELDRRRNRSGIPRAVRSVVPMMPCQTLLPSTADRRGGHLPVEDDQAVPQPVGRVGTRSHECGDTQRPRRSTIDGHSDALSKGSVRVLWQDRLRGLCHHVDCMPSGSVAVPTT